MTARRAGMIAAAAAVLAAAVVAAVLVLRHGPPRGVSHAAVRAKPAVPSGTVPPQAAAATQLLVSARGRSALSPELSASLRPGRLFPRGTTFTVQRGSWHQAGAFANVSGTLRMPGHAPAPAEVGLMHRGGRWLVTFEATK